MKKQIQKLIDALQMVFNLQGWKINTSFVNECEQCEDSDVYACVIADSVQREAWLNVHERLLSESSDKIVETLIHEFCHIMTEKMHDQTVTMREGKFVTERESMDNWEETTEALAKVITKLLKRSL